MFLITVYMILLYHDQNSLELSFQLLIIDGDTIVGQYATIGCWSCIFGDSSLRWCVCRCNYHYHILSLFHDDQWWRSFIIKILLMMINDYHYHYLMMINSFKYPGVNCYRLRPLRWRLVTLRVVTGRSNHETSPVAATGSRSLPRADGLAVHETSSTRTT